MCLGPEVTSKSISLREVLKKQIPHKRWHFFYHNLGLLWFLKLYDHMKLTLTPTNNIPSKNSAKISSMITLNLNYLVEVHTRFMHDLIEASKLFPHNIYSILPTILFLVSILGLLYVQFQKLIYDSMGWKAKAFKELLFHWTYFYTTRIWFVFMKLCRWIIRYSDKAIEKNSRGDEIYYNKIITHFCVFVLVLSISLVPSLLLSLRYLNRRQIPNFLMWVAEDPWVRSEIGTSGHYLERPPRIEIYNPHKHNASYRSGRSSSVDTNVYLQKPPYFLRHCKSAINVKTSSEDITG